MKCYHTRICHILLYYIILPLFRNHQEPIEKNHTPSVLEDTRVPILVNHRIQSADSQTDLDPEEMVQKVKQVYVLHNIAIFYGTFRHHVVHTQEGSIVSHSNQTDVHRIETDDFQHDHVPPRSLRYKSRRFDWETASEGG